MSRVVLFFAAVFALFSLGALLAPPWADAHTATVTIEPGPCRSDGSWTATYTITPTHLDLNPLATITVEASPFHWRGPWPYSHTAVLAAKTDSYTVSVYIRWDDGVTYPTTAVTAIKPTDCVPALTTTTTTCEQNIAPVVNCAGVPTTTVPTPEPTTVVPPATTVPPDTSSAAPVPPETPPATASPGRTTPARTPVITNLPTTGSETWLLVAVAIGCLVSGVVLALTRPQRRRS